MHPLPSGTGQLWPGAYLGLMRARRPEPDPIVFRLRKRMGRAVLSSGSMSCPRSKARRRSSSSPSSEHRSASKGRPGVAACHSCWRLAFSTSNCLRGHAARRPVRILARRPRRPSRQGPTQAVGPARAYRLRCPPAARRPTAGTRWRRGGPAAATAADARSGHPGRTTAQRARSPAPLRAGGLTCQVDACHDAAVVLRHPDGALSYGHVRGRDPDADRGPDDRVCGRVNQHQSRGSALIGFV
jgi:hypothetical protein